MMRLKVNTRLSSCFLVVYILFIGPAFGQNDESPGSEIISQVQLPPPSSSEEWLHIQTLGFGTLWETGFEEDGQFISDIYLIPPGRLFDEPRSSFWTLTKIENMDPPFLYWIRNADTKKFLTLRRFTEGDFLIIESDHGTFGEESWRTPETMWEIEKIDSGRQKLHEFTIKNYSTGQYIGYNGAYDRIDRPVFEVSADPSNQQAIWRFAKNRYLDAITPEVLAQADVPDDIAGVGEPIEPVDDLPNEPIYPSRPDTTTPEVIEVEEHGPNNVPTTSAGLVKKSGSKANLPEISSNIVKKSKDINKTTIKTAKNAFNKLKIPSSKRYQLFVDCDHRKVSNEITKNSISVSFLDKQGGTIKTINKLSMLSLHDSDCEVSNQFIGTFTDEVAKLVFQTNGDDAFLIDAVVLVENGKRKKKWGKNGGGAWCMSTDPKDAQRSWKSIVKGCYRKIEFPVKGKVKKL